MWCNLLVILSRLVSIDVPVWNSRTVTDQISTRVASDFDDGMHLIGHIVRRFHFGNQFSLNVDFLVSCFYFVFLNALIVSVSLWTMCRCVAVMSIFVNRMCYYHLEFDCFIDIIIQIFLVSKFIQV